LREGKSFAGSLETLPEVFPGLLIGIVRSAERTGNLPEALQRYIDYRRRVDGLRTKVVNAAIYPSLLMLVAVAVTLFLGGYVVPRFAAVYKGTGRPLPWASQLLLDWGSFAGNHAWALLGALGVLGVLGVVGIRSLMRRGGFAHLIRTLPVLADQARIYELSRLYLTLGMLLDSGLPVMPALALAETALPSLLRNALQQAGARIRTGERLSAAFEHGGLATAVGLRMLQVGEESGRLGEMMTRTARFHDEETGRWIERFSRAAEPTLMVAIGLVIGTIVVLLYMPIFDLAGSLR
jgi:general secretion pathway protein F